MVTAHILAKPKLFGHLKRVIGQPTKNWNAMIMQQLHAQTFSNFGCCASNALDSGFFVVFAFCFVVVLRTRNWATMPLP